MKSENSYKFGPAGLSKPEKPLEEESLVCFKTDDNFCLEYAESLAEGDLRPIILENYNEDNDE